MHALIASLFFAFAPARVTHVVVYPDRAQVTRSATISCDAPTAVTFGGIPPSADPQTFRAHATSATVDGLRYEERTRKDAFSAEVEEIDRQLHKLDQESAALDDSAARAAAARNLAGGYSQAAMPMISREMMDSPNNARSWTAAVDQSLAARDKVAAEDAARAVKVRDLNRKRDELLRRRARLYQASARREYVAEVLVSCASAGTAHVELTYMVGGARWEPSYEARADEAHGEVELSTYATVTQATGEDWKNAEVILSTAIPRDNATPPEISALKLYAQERKPPKKVLVRRDELQEHANASGESAGPSGGEGGQTRAVGQGLSVQMAVKDPADVVGDGSPARLLVDRNRVKAQFAYKSAPKMMPFVFRVAELVNTAPFPLMPGALDAFRKNGLAGHYPQERVAEGGRFQLTFGIEERFKVKRETVEEIQRDKGLFGGTRRFRYNYRFEVANYTDAAEEVQVAEHIPVSELDDVKITVDSKATTQYQLNAEDGIVNWRIRLTPNEKKTVNLVYWVDVPSSYDSGNL